MDTVEQKRTVDLEVCEVCERQGKRGAHPCRFEKACSCWRGIPCKRKES